jgi:hypothetical protein
MIIPEDTRNRVAITNPIKIEIYIKENNVIYYLSHLVFLTLSAYFNSTPYALTDIFGL